MPWLLFCGDFMSKITAIQNPAKRQASSEEKAWAVAALRRAARLGRLPRKSDFDPQEAQRIKDYLGPWPRALEAAGLKEVPERIAKRRR